MSDSIFGQSRKVVCIAGFCCCDVDLLSLYDRSEPETLDLGGGAKRGFVASSPHLVILGTT